jgi:hypothetical protein
MSVYNFEEFTMSDCKKVEQILLEHFPPKGNANLRGRILEYGDALLEWAAQQCESGETDGCLAQGCHDADAAAIRSGKSEQ